MSAAEQTREAMIEGIRLLDAHFNAGLTGPARTVGVVVFAFPFGDVEGRRVNYISNGADRAEIVKMLREVANRMDSNTQ